MSNGYCSFVRFTQRCKCHQNLLKPSACYSSIRAAANLNNFSYIYFSFLSLCLFNKNIFFTKESLLQMSELGEEIKGFEEFNKEAEEGPVSSHQITAMAFIFLLFQHTFFSHFFLERFSDLLFFLLKCTRGD